jgi:3-deoxy-7-phosphoheptulonate synthase
MIIILRTDIQPGAVEVVEAKVRELGYEPHTIRGEVRTVVAAVGDESTHASLEPLTHLPMVDRVLPVQKKFKLISRETHPEPVTVPIDGLELGARTFHVIAGPCSVESHEQMLSTAIAVKAAGATLLRGGAFKPRTSPYAFQGLGQAGLDILQAVKAETGLPVVTEIVREGDIDRVCAVADMLQIGARNALNYSLLEAVADTGKPILLKRGIAATIAEWLLAAEYIVKRGNPRVVLCERGIRTFEEATRNTLDLSAVAVAKKEARLPVIVDPSHAAGRWDIIAPLSKAAAAVGADGLIVEVHPHPEIALSDGDQQLRFELFAAMMDEIRPFVLAAQRSMAEPAPAVCAG